MKKIFILGSLNMDVVIGADRIPEQGETLAGYNFMLNPGGKGANQAIACAKAEGQVYMAGCVGCDAFGKQMVQALQQAGVACDYIRQVSSPSGTAVIIVVDADNRIIINAGANADVGRGDIDALLQLAQKGDIFLAQLEVPLDIVQYGLMQAKQKGMLTLLNPAPANTACQGLLPYTDILIPNEIELAILGGSADFNIAANNLLEKYACQLIVTLGDKGSVLIKEGAKHYIDSYEVKVVDTTGAGDTYCGYLAVGLAQGKPMLQSMEYASAAAALTVTLEGASKAIPDNCQVKEFLKKYKNQ